MPLFYKCSLLLGLNKVANKGNSYRSFHFYNDNSIYKLFILLRTYLANKNVTKQTHVIFQQVMEILGNFDTILYFDNFVTTHKYFCSKFFKSTSFNTCDNVG